MRRISILCMAVSCALILSASVWAGGDMQLTLDDGRDVILHEDKTWGFAKFNISEGDEEDMYITIADGRTILLKTDGTWLFTKSDAPKKKSHKEIPVITAQGSAKRATLDQAVNAATVEALNRAAERFKPYVKATKTTQKYIIACIKNEIGENGADVKYEPGWNATAKITLDKAQGKRIVMCVEDQLEPATAPAGQEGSTPAAADSSKPAK